MTDNFKWFTTAETAETAELLAEAEQEEREYREESEYRRAYYDGFFEAFVAAVYMVECGLSKQAVCERLGRHLELDLKKWRDGDGHEEPPVVNLKDVDVCPTCGHRLR